MKITTGESRAKVVCFHSCPDLKNSDERIHFLAFSPFQNHCCSQHESLFLHWQFFLFIWCPRWWEKNNFQFFIIVIHKSFERKKRSSSLFGFQMFSQIRWLQWVLPSLFCPQHIRGLTWSTGGRQIFMSSGSMQVPKSWVSSWLQFAPLWRQGWKSLKNSYECSPKFQSCFEKEMCYLKDFFFAPEVGTAIGCLSGVPGMEFPVALVRTSTQY